MCFDFRIILGFINETLDQTVFHLLFWHNFFMYNVLKTAV